MRTTKPRSGAGLGSAESCKCNGEASESWTELEAYPAQGWTIQPPAFLADSEEWRQLYRGGVTYQDGVRMLLGPEGESLTDPEVDLLLERITESMEPAQAAEFLSGIGRALQGALPVLSQVAQAALPIVGSAVGSIIAPGVGTALGGALGGVAGNLIGQAANQARPPASRPQREPARQPPFGQQMPMPTPQTPIQTRFSPPQMTPQMPLGGMFAQPPFGQQMPMPAPQMPLGGLFAQPQASSSQQLLGLLRNPQLLGGLANAALGGAGAMPGGGTSLSSLLGSLSQLAQGAAAEVAGEGATESFEGDTTSLFAHRLVNAVQGARR